MTDVMILAAGLGTRMKSRRAKVLHELAGRPLIAHVFGAAFDLAPESVYVIVGHQAEEVERAVRDEANRLSARGRGQSPDLHFVLQAEQRGTGHAVMAARELLRNRSGSLIIIAGDVPMMKSETLRRLAETHGSEKNSATVMSVCLADPTGYGRIIRDGDNRFLRCVEQRDASPEELAVCEVNVSLYCFDIADLVSALEDLKSDNAQGEYYLTDVPKVLLNRGKRVGLVCHDRAEEASGINTRIELAALERALRESKLNELMLAGVTLIDPATTYVHQDVEIGQDTVIHPQVIIEGATRIGAGCTIQSWTRLKNVEVGDAVTIRNSSVIEDSRIGDGATVGPFSRLRMSAEIGEKAAIGNFVEVKKSKVGRGTKASHLTYLGDATLGDRVNIGAGTVTCNYDGVNKHQTFIEDEVKIGSDTMLVAPVRVGRGSVTGAGAVVTKDIPPDSLAVGMPAEVKKKLK
ncbi:MAG TPA: bifunctional UDP-N-acetylglucosamine diphosphorylase/glucosamine-1-phosphate N-acetyltransferase GlmU [Blastocatellia bacterium]|nr:bifunctional UDP-N-acetylglucosamine diphosphorylase/glucosamine-1-phosphate N-acetyltransferase GlmU [Blastocatellia bacterium]